MSNISKGKIFLADERGCDEADWYRSYSTFNYGQYVNQHKEAFDVLSVLNDNTLSGDSRYNINIEKSCIMLLLPVVGAVSYKDTNGNENTLHAGQLHVSYLPPCAYIEISNPFKDDLINFLHLQIEAEIPPINSKAEIYSFDVDKNRNNLIELRRSFAVNTVAAIQPPSMSMSIGKFTAREEAIYKLKNIQGCLFVFVIQGVFEVEGRLLNARDGLGLWHISEYIELEALSNDAIVLIVELETSTRL